MMPAYRLSRMVPPDGKRYAESSIRTIRTEYIAATPCARHLTDASVRAAYRPRSIHRGANMIKVTGYAAKHSYSRLKPYEFEREEAGAHEVEIDVLYCGVCH